MILKLSAQKSADRFSVGAFKEEFTITIQVCLQIRRQSLYHFCLDRLADSMAQVQNEAQMALDLFHQLVRFELDSK